MMTIIPSPVRRAVEALLAPLVSGLIRAGVNPNVLTTIGVLVLVGSGVAFGVGWVRLGGFLLLLSGVMDMLDGRVARGGNVVSKFGAFYDSTLDRVGESFLFGGIAVYFSTGGVAEEWRTAALVTTLVALSAGLTVSYARARAEGLQMECKVGVAQRAERILGLGIPTLFFGAGPGGFLLLVVVAILALLAVITVGQRIHHIHRITARRRDRRTQAGFVKPAVADMSLKGKSK
jgi:CDP-diacylglycerol--glycerol-3-phosphate 3-phosphatidyltransferase